MKEGEKRAGGVPHLRFPGFEGEWEEKRLGEIAEIVRGGSPRPIESFITDNPHGLNWLKIGDINRDSKYVVKTEEKVIHSAIQKTRVVNPGDLILSNSMSFGRPYILKITTCIHDGWIAVTHIHKRVYTDYLYYEILGPTSQTYFLSNAAGSGVLNLNAEIIKALPIKFSSLPEQQKVADCLSSLDDLLTAHTKKLDTLKTYKKGLLQQLFPADGATTPALRFPQFHHAGEWEEKKIEELCEFQEGYSFPSSSFVSKSPDTLQVIRITDINNKNGNVEKVYINATVVQERRLTNYLVEKGDLLLSLTGAAGFNFFIWDSESSILNQRTMKISFKKEHSLKLLLEYLLSDQINAKGTGQNNNLSKDSLRNLLVKVPLCPEQQKIADCLSSLDSLISAQEQKIHTLKLHKKALMQQLFPQSGEAMV
ncbi:MAG: restriction endonuclease subunit S [Spirochaetales bacterium]|nr:restriction endonuclease subunit S [Spirochaetales bacterium]